MTLMETDTVVQKQSSSTINEEDEEEIRRHTFTYADYCKLEARVRALDAKFDDGKYCPHRAKLMIKGFSCGVLFMAFLFLVMWRPTCDTTKLMDSLSECTAINNGLKNDTATCETSLRELRQIESMEIDALKHSLTLCLRYQHIMQDEEGVCSNVESKETHTLPEDATNEDHVHADEHPTKRGACDPIPKPSYTETVIFDTSIVVLICIAVVECVKGVCVKDRTDNGRVVRKRKKAATQE
jgi:hypothetical protein